MDGHPFGGMTPTQQTLNQHGSRRQILGSCFSNPLFHMITTVQIFPWPTIFEKILTAQQA
jgi:hypothetical protein